MNTPVAYSARVLPFVAALLLAAGPSGCGGCGDASVPCATDQQCPAGQICSLGFCGSACGEGCGAGEVCDNGACLPRHCPTQACPDNAFCFDGACTFAGCREVACGADSLCVPGGTCVPTNCGSQKCSGGQACNPDSDRCEDASCIGVSCGADQTCFFGKCRERTCHGRSCGGSFCVDGEHCKDCPDTPCPGETVCVAGACQPIGCSMDPPTNCPCPPESQNPLSCGFGEICLPLPQPDAQGEPVPNQQPAPSGLCATQDCPTFQCPDGTVCAGESCAPTRCVRDAVRCGEEESCGADGECHATTCNDVPCPVGFGCDGSVCKPLLCFGVTCPAGSECFGGGCYSKSCGDTPCPAGQLCIDGACRPAYGDPPAPVSCGGTVCPDGYTCDDQNNCSPAECVSGDCPGRCGNNFCQPEQYCKDGRCLNKCTMCPEGFVCTNGSLPPCVHVDCLNVQCPARTHCVAGPGPGQARCEENACGDEVCRSSESCQNNVCVDQACIGKDCGPNGRCIQGACFERCCPGRQCASDDLCIGGEQYPQHCLTHACPAGTVCVGDTCQPLAPPDPACLANKRPETSPNGLPYCDYVDNDCNGFVDDGFVTPRIRQSDGKWDMGPNAKGGYQCAQCKYVGINKGVNGTQYGADVSCGTDMKDGSRSVYAGLASGNTGQRLGYLWDEHDDAYWKSFKEVAEMTSCVRFELPCTMMASKVHVRFAGATQVPCRPDDQCSGDCLGSRVHTFAYDKSWNDWLPFGRSSAPVDVYQMKAFTLDEFWEGKAKLRHFLICRGDYGTGRGNLSIDGVTVEGCCIP